jgi:hypothetical protein
MRLNLYRVIPLLFLLPFMHGCQPPAQSGAADTATPSGPTGPSQNPTGVAIVNPKTSYTSGNQITLSGTNMMDTSLTLVCLYNDAATSGTPNPWIVIGSGSATSLTFTVPQVSPGTYSIFLESSHGNGLTPLGLSQPSDAISIKITSGTG